MEPRRQQWRPGLNVLLGPNGAGKTNLLETFSVLSGWGAFMTATPAAGQPSSLVAWGAETGAFLTCRAEGERELEVQARIGTRMSLRAANERVTYSELRALLPSLSFLARDIDLLDGPPSVRRFFLDKICALCSPLYARRLAEYKQLVRQRAALLRQRDRNEAALRAAAIRATALPTARLGGWVRDCRKKAVELLSNVFLEERSFFGLLPFEIGISLEIRGGMGLEDSAQDLAAALEASRERESYAGTVLVGPHRDDLLFSCLGRSAASALSRGQKRRVVVALILAAGRLVEARLRLKPVLLLDDVAAELDEEGKTLMGKALAVTGWQVFATGVENPFTRTCCGTACSVTEWHVREGRIAERR